uniref:Uncharacterized protein n=1 Tax=Acanthochromis polyacanthus TaxID=80966 RepID=A0A3Q1EMV3_9TELE
MTLEDKFSSERGLGELLVGRTGGLKESSSEQGCSYSPLTSLQRSCSQISFCSSRRERPYMCVLRINSIKIICTVWRLLKTRCWVTGALPTE